MKFNWNEMLFDIDIVSHHRACDHIAEALQHIQTWLQQLTVLRFWIITSRYNFGHGTSHPIESFIVKQGCCSKILTNSVHNMGRIMLLNLAALVVPLRSPSAMLIWNRTVTSRGRPDFWKKEIMIEGQSISTRNFVRTCILKIIMAIVFVRRCCVMQ